MPCAPTGRGRMAARETNLKIAAELLLLLMLMLSSSSLSLLLSLSCLFYFLVKSFRRKLAARPPGVPWIWMSSRGQPPSMRLKRRRLRCLAWSGRSAPRALPQDDLEAAPPQCPRLPGSSPQGSSAFVECPPAHANDRNHGSTRTARLSPAEPANLFVLL